MEVSALRHAGVAGLHGRSPLLRLQSDERLIALVRRGNHGAFEVLVGRYQSRLLAFCRHMLGSREDAEDVLQEVFAAAFNAILADTRPINARPWLYRIARNRSLNHLRRVQAIGVDSMDVHLAEHGASTADKVDGREALRELLADVRDLPETQRTALLLREIDALSYEQIAEAMETTIPSVKSLLVRARVSLAEAAEARQLSCEEVRLELGEVAEGLKRRTTPPVRRHLRSCDRCATFRVQLRATNKALALALPVGPLLLLKKLLLAHLGLSAGAGGAGGTAGTAAVGAATAGSAAGSAGGGLLSAGLGAVATKAAASMAAAAIVAAGAVEIEHRVPHRAHPRPRALAQAPARRETPVIVPRTATEAPRADAVPAHAAPAHTTRAAKRKPAAVETPPAAAPTTTVSTTAASTTTAAEPGETQVESSTTSLPTTLPSTPPPTAPEPTATVTVPGTPPSATPPTATPPPTTPAPPPDGTTPVPPPPGSFAPDPTVDDPPPTVVP